MAQPKLEAVDGDRKHPKSENEKRIEELSGMTGEQLSFADLFVLGRIRDLRASVLETENEMVELRAVLKARKKSLDTALLEAAMHYDNRNLAKAFAGK
jgi:hypothetical protein